MKIAIAQLNPIVGDTKGNLKKLHDAVENIPVGDADLIITPELFVCGYFPKDLLNFNWFLENVQIANESIRELSAQRPDLGILVGTIRNNGKIHGKKILKKVMENGKRLYREKTLEEKRKLFLSKSTLFPGYLKELNSKKSYPVDTSPGLSNLTKTLGQEIQKRTKEKVLFIDIDTQEDFLHKNGALYVPGSEQVRQNAKKLTFFAHKNGILIISSQDTNKKDDPEFEEFASHCVKGTKGHRKAKETLLSKSKIITSKKLYPVEELKNLAEKYEQLIIEKNTLCVFANPNMEPLLEAVFPDKIYLYGLVTEYCIREAVEGLIKHSFFVYIIEDAVKEISSKEKEKLFANWKKRGVKFVKTQDVLRI